MVAVCSITNSTTGSLIQSCDRRVPHERQIKTLSQSKGNTFEVRMYQYNADRSPIILEDHTILVLPFTIHFTMKQAFQVGNR